MWADHFARAESTVTALTGPRARDATSLRSLLLALLAQGKDDEMMKALESYSKLLPASPYDHFIPDLVDELSGLQDRRFYELLRRYAVRLAEAKGLDAVDRRRALDMAVRYSYATGRVDEGWKLTRRLNRLPYWGLLGPFDNTSGSGHWKQHLDDWRWVAKLYEGKYGQKITWFKPVHLSAGNSLVPNRHFARGDFTTAYVRTCVVVPESGTYLVSVSYKGDMTFLLNSSLVHEGSRHNGGDEVLHWLVDLPAGANRFAFKISNRDEDGELACAVSHPDGRTVDGLAVAQFKNEMPANPPPLNARRMESTSLREIQRRAESAPNDLEAAFWNLRRLRQSAGPERVRAYADSLVAAHPRSALLRLGAALAYAGSGDKDRAKQAMRAAAELDSCVAPARLRVGREDLEKKRHARAAATARAVLRSAPSCRQAMGLLFDALEESQLIQELEREARAFRAKLPEEPSPMWALMTCAEAQGKKDEARALRSQAVKRLPLAAASFERMRRALEKDDPAKAKGDIADLLALAPDVPWLWGLYVHALLASKEVQTALVRLDKALESFPQDVGLIDLKSRLAEAGAYTNLAGWRTPTGGVIWKDSSGKTLTDDDVSTINREKAAEILDKALASDPANFKIRDRILALRGKPSFRTALPDPVEDEIVGRRVDPLARPGVDAVVLLEQHRSLLLTGGAALRDHVIAVQLLTAAGVERWSNFSVPLSRDVNDVVFLTHKTIKADGAQREARVALGEVVFTDAAPGDIVLLHYQVTSYVSGSLAGHFWDQHVFGFWLDPCLESSYSIITCSREACRYTLWNADDLPAAELPAEKRLPSGCIELTWRLRDLQPAGGEPLGAPATAFRPWLDLSTLKSWGDVASWYADLADGQAEVTGAVRAKAHELTAGCADDEGRVRRLLAFVANEITYQSMPLFQSAFIPRPAAEVLQDRWGDCKDKSCLLIALLKASGIDNARFALTTPGAAGRTRFLPSPRFTHVVVHHVLPDGSERWYDPTVRYGLADQVPRSLAGAPALVVDAQTKALGTIVPPDVERHPFRAITRVALDERGDAVITARTLYSLVDQAALLRDELASATPERLRDRFAQALAPEHPGVSVSSATVLGMGAPDSTLVLASEWSVPELAQLAPDYVALRVPWSTSLRDLLGTVVAKPSRTSPIDLRLLNVAEEDEVTLSLPRGRHAAAAPEGATYEWRGCRYATRFEAFDGGLRGVRSLVIKGSLVGREDYTGFKEFLENVRRDMRRTVIVRCR